MDVFRFKVIFLGDRNVGKTSLALLHKTGSVSCQTSVTIGFESYKKRVSLTTGCHATVDLWDTAGMERFKDSMLPKYFDANGVILVYDITSAESFGGLESWLRLLPKRPGLRVALVGNKADRVNGVNGGGQRKVPTQQARDFALQHGMLFEELSAKEPADAKRLGLLVQSLTNEMQRAYADEASAKDGGGNGGEREPFKDITESIIDSPQLEASAAAMRERRNRCGC